VLIPLHSLPERMSELDSSREIVLHCHVGQRSMRALEMLHRSGFRKLKNLRGGIEAWSRDVDPTVPATDRGRPALPATPAVTVPGPRRV
jgi:adenylyltransferase/sulfurtransferase